MNADEQKMYDQLCVALVTSKHALLQLWTELTQIEGELAVPGLYNSDRSKHASLKADRTAKIAEIDDCQDHTKRIKQAIGLLQPASNAVGSSNKHWSLPKLDKEDLFVTNKTDLHNFYEDMEAKLLAHSTPEEHWYKILGKATTDTVLRWVKTHILKLEPAPTWDQAKTLFSAEFTPQNYAFLCGSQLLALEQGNTSGADFMREVELLATEAKQDLTEQFFLQHLRSKFNIKYQRALSAQLGAGVNTASFAEVKAQLVFLDSQDLAHYDQPKASNPKNSRCRKCNSTNHSTAEHRNPDPKSTSEPKGRQPSPVVSDTEPFAYSRKRVRGDIKNIDCHACGLNGHFADDPDCPNKKSTNKQPTSANTNKTSVNAQEIRRILAVRLEQDNAQAEDTAGTEGEITNQMLADAMYELQKARREGEK